MFGGESVQYKVLVVDNSNYDLRHYSSMSVFEECGFEMCSHTSEPTKAISAAAEMRAAYMVGFKDGVSLMGEAME